MALFIWMVDFFIGFIDFSWVSTLTDFCSFGMELSDVSSGCCSSLTFLVLSSSLFRSTAATGKHNVDNNCWKNLKITNSIFTPRYYNLIQFGLHLKNFFTTRIVYFSSFTSMSYTAQNFLYVNSVINVGGKVRYVLSV